MKKKQEMLIKTEKQEILIKTEKLELVKHGLKCCTTIGVNCKECPYFSSDQDVGSTSCDIQLMTDALKCILDLEDICKLLEVENEKSKEK